MAKEQNLRRHERIKADFAATITRTAVAGFTRSIEGRGLDVSRSGTRIEASEPMEPGAPVYVQAAKYCVLGHAYIRRSEACNQSYLLAIQFSEETGAAVRLPSTLRTDYYELLQISPHADHETIHRVFRIMAARFHPDNPKTGDRERFLWLREAYETLSDPTRRAQYDANYSHEDRGPMPIFELRDFVDDIGGELNRRLGVMCLLYNQRRRNVDAPGLSVLQLEQLMSFPREYLDFSIGYLKEKHYIEVRDNSDYSLTAAGMDYVESSTPTNRLAVALLAEPARTDAKKPQQMNAVHPALD